MFTTFVLVVFITEASSAIKTMTAPAVWQSCLQGVLRWHIAAQYNKLQRLDYLVSKLPIVLTPQLDAYGITIASPLLLCSNLKES